MSNQAKPKPAPNLKDQELKFGKTIVKVTNLSKVYWPEEKITKGMLIEYYQQMADFILPYLKDRPESLKRNPNGIRDAGFFHKDAGVDAPLWVKRFNIYSTSSKKDVAYIICNDKSTLAYLNNLGCIELNPWNSRIQSLDKPDYLIIDIDPSSKNNFEQVIEVALAFRELLESLSVEGYCKTSGASGIHIFIPMGKKYDYEQVKNLAHLLCSQVCTQLDKLTTLERNLQKRGDSRIYLDWLQNSEGQTLACAYSLRPKPGATVSTPLEWKEVKAGLDPLAFNIHTAFQRAQQKGDLFKAVLGKGADIRKITEKMETEMEKG